MTLKATPLNFAHRAAGAKMVDFGGWDMPVNYGSQIEEHHAVRVDAGMFDVSHMCVIDIDGANARSFLRGLLANNVDKLQVAGKALYSCMLGADGFVIDDLIVYFFSEDRFRLVVNAGTAAKDIDWINAQNAATGSAVTVTQRRDGIGAMALIAVQGPNARAKVWQVLPGAQAASEPLKPFNATIVANTAFGEVMVARTGYTGEDGFELAFPAQQAEALWNALLSAGVKPAGLGARDTLRLEAGMNLYGQDMDDTVNPLDAGLAWTVDLLSERDFIGKAALIAMGQRYQFLGLILIDKGGVLRAHQKVVGATGSIGETTSGTFSPTMQQAIALARLPMDVAIGDTVKVEIRDKQLAATVVKLPFVRNGKILVA
ncbi:glycine cleavage system aminomethyltransferase GcvT [Massilia psychrophila]|uniref:Aminomethyltransferase n=1 Tax=Massilia psychrophila TaxID=1603353 RepID=A0A2G8T0J2_9BURK|nr:glycine cleavage system aminomethyltransferase GcvT [Massilia psychrophila]PIL39587.1 glycine cleavage system protein T [Massilia psychrophila]GGE74076.1 aminomethyltransferase [Massilia psychrophila]